MAELDGLPLGCCRATLEKLFLCLSGNRIHLDTFFGGLKIIASWFTASCWKERHHQDSLKVSLLVASWLWAASWSLRIKQLYADGKLAAIKEACSGALFLRGAFLVVDSSWGSNCDFDFGLHLELQVVIGILSRDTHSITKHHGYTFCSLPGLCNDVSWMHGTLLLSRRCRGYPRSTSTRANENATNFEFFFSGLRNNYYNGLSMHQAQNRPGYSKLCHKLTINHTIIHSCGDPHYSSNNCIK